MNCKSVLLYARLSNEWYAKDISRKVRSSKKLRGNAGDPCVRAFCKEQFLKAVRKFMEMKTLTPAILHELVERIDVYQTQGRGKNRTQRIVIHYNFIGVLDLPEVEEYPENVVLDSRQGVAIEYLVGKAG